MEDAYDATLPHMRVVVNITTASISITTIILVATIITILVVVARVRSINADPKHYSPRW